MFRGLALETFFRRPDGDPCSHQRISVAAAISKTNQSRHRSSPARIAVQLATVRQDPMYRAETLSVQICTDGYISPFFSEVIEILRKLIFELIFDLVFLLTIIILDNYKYTLH